MPGGPTGRGCDVCRKQKKKCDASGTTSCTRCRRWGVPCIGFGQQRYKFQDEGRKFVRHQSNTDTIKPTSSKALRSNNPQQQQHLINVYTSQSRALPRVPYSNLDRLTHALVDTMDPSLDISIRLDSNLCGFLSLVPSRLGTNDSLDAATDALVTAYTRYRSGHRVADSTVLVKHSLALNTLSKCLNDPVKAHSSETLCAVMLLQTCELWTSTKRTEPRMSHSVGAAQILKNRGHTGPKNDFERTLLYTLRGPVVIEALSDTRIRFTPNEWRTLILSDLSPTTPEAHMMLHLARLPPLMQSSRATLSHPPIDTPTLNSLTREFLNLHHTYQPILSTLRTRWHNISNTLDTNPNLTPAQKRTIHCSHARLLAFGLAIGIVINNALTTLDPTSTTLQPETAQMAQEILELADVMAAYRPLAGLSMILWLGAAWVGVGEDEDDDEGKGRRSMRARIEAVALDYERDIHGDAAELKAQDWEWCRRQISLV